MSKEYIDILQQHVIDPLKGPVGEHCFAVAMLVFAGIDGLGKLIHPEPRVGPGERFKSFLPRLGDKYVDVQKQLWALRNSLDHNALNVACHMSKLDESKAVHLELDDDLIFVHTRVLLADFERAKGQLALEPQQDIEFLRRAESRLTKRRIRNPSWTYSFQTTAPPGPEFVQLR